MEQGRKDIQARTQIADNLEPYQRLVELQKQMIQLAQQNERARQECTELREHLAGEVTRRQGTPQNLHQKVHKALRKLPGTPSQKSNLVSLAIKQPSTC